MTKIITPQYGLSPAFRHSGRRATPINADYLIETEAESGLSAYEEDASYYHARELQTGIKEAITGGTMRPAVRYD